MHANITHMLYQIVEQKGSLFTSNLKWLLRSHRDRGSRFCQLSERICILTNIRNGFDLKSSIIKKLIENFHVTVHSKRLSVKTFSEYVYSSVNASSLGIRGIHMFVNFWPWYVRNPIRRLCRKQINNHTKKIK
jgi:hypothetical protein